jgi:hypothetical protein
MRLQPASILALAALMPAGANADDSSWIFAPARYTHSPETGQRVVQYSPGAPAYLRYDDTYQESGYRHNTVSICAGDSSDHLHIVQTWGQGLLIRPYGEWEYPYRPGATPYGPWSYPQVYPQANWGNNPGPWPTPYSSWQNPYGFGPASQGPWSSWSNPPGGCPAPTPPMSPPPPASPPPSSGPSGNGPSGGTPTPPPPAA